MTDPFPYGNTPCYLHIRDARDALMRGRPDIGETLAALDRAEADGIADWRVRRERAAMAGHAPPAEVQSAADIADLDHARRALAEGKPHEALPLLDRIVAGMRQPPNPNPGLPLKAAGFLPR